MEGRRTRLTEPEVEALINAYRQEIKRLAGRFKLTDNSVCSSEDLESVGLMALIEAANRYDPEDESGAQLRTFIHRRVFGAMADEVRKFDMVGRRSRENFKLISREQDRIYRETGKQIDIYEAGKALGLKDSSVRHMVLQFTTTFSLDEELESTHSGDTFNRYDVISDSRSPCPEREAEKKEFFREYLLAKLELSPVIREFITLCGEEGLTLKRAGEIVGITESAMSRRGKTAEKKFKSLLGDFV